MEAALKEAVREAERAAARQDLGGRPIDMEYLKNCVLQLFTKGDGEALLPVFATLLKFSPEELGRAKQVRGVAGCGWVAVP
jgi:hypothetical protein